MSYYWLPVDNKATNPAASPVDMAKLTGGDTDLST